MQSRKNSSVRQTSCNCDQQERQQDTSDFGRTSQRLRTADPQASPVNPSCCIGTRRVDRVESRSAIAYSDGPRATPASECVCVCDRVCQAQVSAECVSSRGVRYDLGARPECSPVCVWPPPPPIPLSPAAPTLLLHKGLRPVHSQIATTIAVDLGPPTRLLTARRAGISMARRHGAACRGKAQPVASDGLPWPLSLPFTKGVVCFTGRPQAPAPRPRLRPGPGPAYGPAPGPA